MTVVLRVVLAVACILTCCYTLHKIRKSQMQIEDSLFWIVISVVLVILSIFPQIARFFADMLGIGATVNFVFLAMIFILVMKVFTMSIKISQMEYRIKNLVQKIAIRNHAEEERLETIQKEVSKILKDLEDKKKGEQNRRNDI